MHISVQGRGKGERDAPVSRWTAGQTNLHLEKETTSEGKV